MKAFLSDHEMRQDYLADEYASIVSDPDASELVLTYSAKRAESEARAILADHEQPNGGGWNHVSLNELRDYTGWDRRWSRAAERVAESIARALDGGAFDAR